MIATDTPTPRSRQAVVRTLLLTDLCNSTALMRDIGDARAAALFERHDAFARSLLGEFNGREIDRTDGFLFLFERPIDAVGYALAYHARLAEVAAAESVGLESRAAIHLGEVILRENPLHDVRRGAKPLEVEGIAKPLAARVTSLAMPGQTLITRGAFDLARRAALEVAALPSGIRWIAHGPYVLKGVEEPIDIFEVGIDKRAPLAAPPDSEKARRAVAPGDEVTLGWRPARGQQIPLRPNWRLDSKLGEGGFGEVWLGVHAGTLDKRVFKFCFAAERLRGLKREAMLFRVLKEKLGDREDIARILDWQFDEPPFFLESEYTDGGNLAEYIEQNGGITALPLERRLELLAEIADAIAAAHSAGILHKDIKPSNVLVWLDNAGRPHIRLTDFGVGLLIDPQILTSVGGGDGASTVTLSAAGDRTSIISGTRLYMAPEIIEGRQPTTRSDIYSLGVLCFQMLAGDFRRALGEGWDREIDDEYLRGYIAQAVDRDPAKRHADAAELAAELRNWKSIREEEERDLARSERIRLGALVALFSLFTASIYGFHHYMIVQRALPDGHFNLAVWGMLLQAFLGPVVLYDVQRIVTDHLVFRGVERHLAGGAAFGMALRYLALVSGLPFIGFLIYLFRRPWIIRASKNRDLDSFRPEDLANWCFGALIFAAGLILAGIFAPSLYDHFRGSIALFYVASLQVYLAVMWFAFPFLFSLHLLSTLVSRRRSSLSKGARRKVIVSLVIGGTCTVVIFTMMLFATIGQYTGLSVLSNMDSISQMYEWRRQYVPAEAMRRTSLDVRRMNFGSENREYAGLLVGLASNLIRQRRHAEAEPLLLQAAAITREIDAPRPERLALIEGLHAAVMLRMGRVAEADATFARAAAILREHREAAADDLPNVLTSYAGALDAHAPGSERALDLQRESAQATTEVTRRAGASGQRALVDAHHHLAYARMLAARGRAEESRQVASATADDLSPHIPEGISILQRHQFGALLDAYAQALGLAGRQDDAAPIIESLREINWILLDDETTDTLRRVAP